MPFSLVAYSESQDSAALVYIAAVADPHVTVSGDDIYVPELTQLSGFLFMGANFSQGQIESPSLKAQNLIDVEPGDGADEPASPSNFHDLFDAPVPLARSEALRTLMAEDGAGATRVSALLWLSDGPITPARGKIITVRATNGSTLVANAWTNGALTFSQTLPAGRYDIAGMRAESAGLRAARLVIPGFPWRPGVPGFDADGDLDVPRFRYGRAGVFGSFFHNEPPTVDFFSASADTSQVVWLDLIKVA